MFQEEQVIRVHHEGLCHLGVEKCYEYIKGVYWFPDMKPKIKQLISRCLKCIYFSPISGKTEGNLHNIDKGKTPFEFLHVDHLGPLSLTKNKMRHILLVIDGFTKFVKLYAVKSTKTEEVICCLNNYFVTYSRPQKIVSDRGSCFTSEKFKEFVSQFDIQHIKIATLSPQSNGQAERINRIIVPMLAK